jgi:hypothetical protein
MGPIRERGFGCFSICVALVASLEAQAQSKNASSEDGVPPVVPVVRGMIGPAFHVGGRSLAEFMTDVDAGITTVRGAHWQYFFDEELGYSFDHAGLQAFNLMGAIGAGWDDLAYVTYQPRLLVGTLDGKVAAGMRNGLGGHFFGQMLDVELGFQILWSGGHPSESVTATVGINVAAPIFMTVASVR